MRLSFAASILYGAVMATAHAAPAHPPVVDVKLDLVDKVGRSTTEYFYSPIIGINYIDVTQISNSFVNGDPNQSGNSLSVTHTELGGVIGLLVDGQYQILATEYWRAGFQTGFYYNSPAESEFAGDCPGNDCIPNGTLKISSMNVPMMFTFARYAASDKYITTAKLGPVISYQMYDIELSDFDADPQNEFQAQFQIGIDGRYRLGKSDNFFLTGFQTTFSMGGGGNGGFSGVDAGTGFGVYIGISFS